MPAFAGPVTKVILALWSDTVDTGLTGFFMPTRDWCEVRRLRLGSELVF